MWAMPKRVGVIWDVSPVPFGSKESHDPPKVSRWLRAKSEREVGSVEVPDVCPGVMFPEQLSQRLQQVCVVQPERLGRVPHAGPLTHQDHEEQCQLTFLLLSFLLTTPSLLTALTGLSLANSICPFPHLFSRTTSKNFSQYRLLSITSLRFP